VTAGAGGRLIALEGIDGCGKTTQARLLADRLDALLTFEPGATQLGGSLRTLLLDPSRPAVTERAEALLLAADRAQHVAEVLDPALGVGRWVVSDRYAASTLAYQGYGRGMDRVELDRLVTWATGGRRADLNVLVDVPVDVATARRAADRGDRFESLGEGFHRRVADGFRALAAEDPAAWVVVDGTPDERLVAEAVWEAVHGRLGAPLRG
jgi:dTMP kinase